MNPEKLIAKAEKSPFYLSLLNLVLYRMIPFNKPHRISIHSINKTDITARLPFRKSNYNHIRGLHACGIATLAEFTTGLGLLRRLDTKRYRIIMKDIQLRYYFQGKKEARATFALTDSWLLETVISPLEQQEKIEVPVEIKVMDTDDNHLATANITWQIKAWSTVKTHK